MCQATFEVLNVQNQPSVFKSTFDQCEFGLMSPGRDPLPMKKRTSLLSNSHHIHQCFANRFCKGEHQHQTIQGSEDGIKRSQAAQVYPGPMVEALCQTILEESKSFDGFH